MSEDIRETLPKKSTLPLALKIIFCLVSCALTMVVIFQVFIGDVVFPSIFSGENTQLYLMDRFDSFIDESLTDAKEAVLSVKKHFWISDSAEIAPEPDHERFGETGDPTSLQWLLDDAAPLLEGQDTLFRTDVEIMPDSKVTYYLDETIFAVTWKQVFGNFVYTISEIKISDPSQLRRYVADNTFDSANRYSTTDMSRMTNAVVASSGDYYRNRNFGIYVYDGEVKRVSSGNFADTCYVDVNGDLLFTRRGEILDVETAQKFVDEHNISFSLAFGPILIDNGVRCEHATYSLGEVNDHYARAAFGQRDTLHYVLVVANAEGRYNGYQTIHEFAAHLETLNCDKFYALDGGQTGVIAMNHKLINRVEFGYQRLISDIIYFATALPPKNTNSQ